MPPPSNVIALIRAATGWRVRSEVVGSLTTAHPSIAAMAESRTTVLANSNDRTLIRTSSRHQTTNPSHRVRGSSPVRLSRVLPARSGVAVDATGKVRIGLLVIGHGKIDVRSVRRTARLVELAGREDVVLRPSI